MTEEEKKELYRYFKLASLRDDNNLLLEEYYELNDIIKKNKYAKIQEEARFNWITGKLSDEKYQKIYEMYDNIKENNLKR